MDSLKEIKRKLSDWSGGIVETWDYTVSHGILRLKISIPENESCVVLYCYDCERVAFFSIWKNMKIEIRERNEKDFKRYEILDGERLAVDCGSVTLSKKLADYSEIPKSPLWEGPP